MGCGAECRAGAAVRSLGKVGPDAGGNLVEFNVSNAALAVSRSLVQYFRLWALTRCSLAFQNSTKRFTSQRKTSFPARKLAMVRTQKLDTFTSMSFTALST